MWRGLQSLFWRGVQSELQGDGFALPGLPFFSKQTQKGHPSGWPLHLFDVWQFPTLTWGDPTLPSALRRFTSEFGMGSGGTTALKPPGKFCYLYQAENHVCLFAKTSSAL